MCGTRCYGTMQTLNEMFTRLQRNPSDTGARWVIEQVIADLKRSMFQVTAMAVRDHLDTVLRGESK